MKKTRLIGALMFSGILLLSGCGKSGNDADTDKTGKEDNVVINKENEEGGSIERGQGYGFTQFDLSIDVDGKDAIEADYDVDKEETEAEFENKLNNVKLDDKEAIDELHLLFMDIRLTSETTDEEAIDNILQWFEIDTYSKFDLEVEFDDGTKLNINDTK